MVTAPHAPVPFTPSLEDVYTPSSDEIVKVATSMVKG